MALLGQHLHQPVLTVASIHAEGQPYGQETGYRSKRKAYQLADTGHIQDNHCKKYRYETSGKKEKVLRFQALELNRTARSLVDTVIHGLQEEGTENGGGHNQKDAGEEPARRGLGRIRVAAAELAVRLDTADQTEYGSDGITQFCGRIEI